MSLIILGFCEKKFEKKFFFDEAVYDEGACWHVKRRGK